MKNIGLAFLQVLILVVVCQFIYWTVLDLVSFNTVFLDWGLYILYYTMPALVALALSLTLLFVFRESPAPIGHLLLVLINVYSVAGLFNIIFERCHAQQNLNIIYKGLIGFLLIVVGSMVLFKIIPKMKPREIGIVALATLLFLVDALYYLIGYRLMYPGFW